MRQCVGVTIGTSCRGRVHFITAAAGQKV